MEVIFIPCPQTNLGVLSDANVGKPTIVNSRGMKYIGSRSSALLGQDWLRALIRIELLPVSWLCL